MHQTHRADRTPEYRGAVIDRMRRMMTTPMRRMAMLAAIGATVVALVVAGLSGAGLGRGEPVGQHPSRRSIRREHLPDRPALAARRRAAGSSTSRSPVRSTVPPRSSRCSMSPVNNPTLADATPCRTERLMTVTAIKDPRRYFEAVDTRKRQATAPPVCLYLEVTNRCNLLCETCPRTFETLEPPADMTWELFTSIVDQVPDVARVVLHGVGEPMLVKTLPRMIRHLKDRGVYVLFNTNGTLLSAKKHQAMIDTGLDELRVSLDAADAKTFLAVRGKNFFDRIVRNVRSFTELQRATGATSPRVSLWLTGLKETIDQLPAFVRLAASMGVREVYLQRLTYDEAGYGLARFESSLFERLRADESRAIEDAVALARDLGIALDASGATEPGLSLKQQDATQPWSACRRPWSLMYFTAHGRALPCCIAPFSARGYDSYTLGDATQQTLREIWNSATYQDFRGALLSETPPRPCANCGLRWSL